MKIPEYWLYWTYQQRHLLAEQLYTTDHLPVNILETGIMNPEEGPDFQNALLEIGGVRCRGDVEFHIHAADWHRHGHDQDERYRRIILHILWDESGGISPQLAARFPHLLMRRQLALAEPAWRQRMCTLEHAEGIFARPLPQQNIIAALDAATLSCHAEARFQRKVERYRQWSRQFSFEDLLYIALAEVLGYSRNKFPFRQLLWEQPPSCFPRFPDGFSGSALPIWIYLALRGGLLDQRHFLKHRFPDAAAVNLFQAFRRRGICPVLQQSDWHFAPVRPANHPLLRLAAFSQLIYRYKNDSLFSCLLEIAMARAPYSATLAAWEAALSQAADHLLFAAVSATLEFKKLPRRWIGKTRLQQFFLNALLPILFSWAIRTGNHGFRCYLEGFYEAFPPLEDSRLLRNGLVLVETASLVRKIEKSAYYQQGLLEMLMASSGKNR